MPARTPEDCDRLFGEYLNAGELESLAALYERGASLVQQNGSVVTGHSALREALRGFVAMRPKIRMNVVKVVKAGEDLAVLYNDWSISGRTGRTGSRRSWSGRRWKWCGGSRTGRGCSRSTHRSPAADPRLRDATLEKVLGRFGAADRAQRPHEEAVSLDGGTSGARLTPSPARIREKSSHRA